MVSSQTNSNSLVNLGQTRVTQAAESSDEGEIRGLPERILEAVQEQSVARIEMNELSRQNYHPGDNPLESSKEAMDKRLISVESSIDEDQVVRSGLVGQKTRNVVAVLTEENQLNIKSASIRPELAMKIEPQAVSDQNYSPMALQ